MTITSNKKVLIIDDDNRNIFALAAFLKTRKILAVSAPGAKEGLTMIEDDAGIAVVLIDIMMPDMDGYEAIKYLRNQQRFASLPVIAVTAQAMTGDKEKCLDAGANDYISKPINVDLLLELLHKYLN